MCLEQLNAAQVEWLHNNKQMTDWYTKDKQRMYLIGYVHIGMVKRGYEMYLTPETYNQLPTEFKQLRDE